MNVTIINNNKNDNYNNLKTRENQGNIKIKLDYLLFSKILNVDIFTGQNLKTLGWFINLSLGHV